MFILAVVRMDWALRTGIHYRSAARELEWDSEFVARQTEQLADESGIGHECWFIRSCRPGRAITRTAEEIRASCIAIGSPGASVLDRVLAGGIYREVVKHAECPVLVVRCKRADQNGGGSGAIMKGLIRFTRSLGYR